MNRSKAISLLLPALAFTACAQKKHLYTSPEGYTFNNPVIYNMPDALLEVSGIAFHDGKSDTIYAEQDEEGKIFYFRPGEGTQQATGIKFGKNGDYEDIALCGDYVILLRSDGVLFGIPFAEVRQGAIATVTKWKDLLPAGEYEGMYADNASSRIFVLCKNCKKDKHTNQVSGYILQMAGGGSLQPAGNFSIATSDIARMTGVKAIQLKPSALAKNNRTGEWYVLSSVNKMLVITDEQWNTKEIFRLDPALFIQPEGIAFDREHALYISNEGSGAKPGTVLKFTFHASR